MAQERKHANPAQRQAAYRKRCEAARQQQLSTRGLPPLPAIATLPGQGTLDSGSLFGSGSGRAGQHRDARLL